MIFMLGMSGYLVSIYGSICLNIVLVGSVLVDLVECSRDLGNGTVEEWMYEPRVLILNHDW